ncbi:MAG: BamA/TamA family outer membrane protein [Prevotella sp.]|nr:BamA/TamA family outer membrane protein [Prevotella sp.]
MKKKRFALFFSLPVMLALVLLASGCSSTKFVEDGSYLLEKVVIKSDSKQVDGSQLMPYVRQNTNSKWFSLLKIPLGTYSMAGSDSTKWINRALKKIGEEPVIYDSLLARETCDDLRTALANMGYMNADVTVTEKTNGKKLTAIYTLHPGNPFFISEVNYDIQDEDIARLLDNDEERGRRLKSGSMFTVPALDAERKRLTAQLLDSGYYRFNKDYIRYTADTVAGKRDVALTLHLLKYRANNDMPETLHPRYTIGKLTFSSGDSDSLIHLREKVLRDNTLIEEGKPFSASDLQKTYNNFGRLQAVRYTNIRLAEATDTLQLDCNVQISTNKPSTVSFLPEGTNTAGNLGAAAALTYENRNIFQGSETFSVQLRGAFEAITKLEGYTNHNYKEYSIETKLSFPRFVAPFLSSSLRRKSGASSEFSLAFDMQNRPEFHRRVFSAGWRYRWSLQNITYKLDFLDMNYVYMPWISPTFKTDYLDNVNSRNAILRYNYEDLFIVKFGFGFSYTDNNDALRMNVESAGNMLNAAMAAMRKGTNEDGQYTLFNIAFAQYAKFDFDYAHFFEFDRNNSLALHAAFGIAYPYGNSRVLPFEKRYFSGGANSVRGWNVRSLGPGKFKGDKGAIDFINQTGDMKLDMNVEYRTWLFWKFSGAFFVDAGNIWTLRNYKEQPGGQFKLDEFFKQIAVSYGMGLRLNFGYFILRFDMGMKAVNPAYENSHEHWALLHPKFSRDFAFHFAVGLPF